MSQIRSIFGSVLGGFLINRLPTSSLFMCAAITVLCCAGATHFLERAPRSCAAREAPELS